MTIKYLIPFFAVAVAPCHAGTIILPTFGTEWDRESEPGQAKVITETSYEIDLDDRTGLIPNQPIKITISSPDRLLWIGGFHIEGGDTELSINTDLSLMLGGNTSSVSALIYQNFGDLTGLNVSGNGDMFSDPVGFYQGPILPEISLIVPWDTDLSKAVINFGQDAEITGAGNYFNQSSIFLTGGTAEGTSVLSFNAVSVPEPGSALLITLAGIGVLARRRR